MTYRLGENLQREWDADPLAVELWEALRELETSPQAAVETLRNLAERGSPLAMMHLGDVFVYGREGLPIDKEAGEYWLALSAKGGSIEGRFRLANFFVREKRGDVALTQWQKLAAVGYTPAIFYLGYCYYKGHLGLRTNHEKAFALWRRAMSDGHLHSAHWLASSYQSDGYGVLRKLTGLWIKTKILVPWIWHLQRYPTSDRLRAPFRMSVMEGELDNHEEKHAIAG